MCDPVYMPTQNIHYRSISVPLEEHALHFEYARFDLIVVFFAPPNPAAVVVWDSQVKDGYRRGQAPATDGSKSGDTLTRAAPVAWDGKKTSGVVEELLRNASDKAYGANGEILSALKV